MSTVASIEMLFVGRVKPLERKGHVAVPSGIVKQPHPGPLRVSFNGVEGDEQGDLLVHGGVEKAIHHYPADHYEFWRSVYPCSVVPLVPGAFGENISTSGMTEHNVCIGDIYRAGSTLLQISQGRQPCWKLNRLLNEREAALMMQTSGSTGWYYRVLEEGWLARHDRFELVDRPCPAWTMERLINALFPLDPGAPGLPEEWHEASTIKQLTAKWQTTFARRVQLNAMEDWTRRLYEA